MSAIKKTIKKTIKKEKTGNKRWSDNELKQILEYLQENSEFEKTTAQIFYRKFLEATGIDATWDIVRWKVKHLKSTYTKAEAWRNSTGAGLVETDNGISSVQDKLRKICRFYDELNGIFGRKSEEFPFQIFDTATTSNMVLNSTPVAHSTLSSQDEFCGFERDSDFCMTPVIQYGGSEATAIEDDCVEILNISPIAVSQSLTPPASTPPTSTPPDSSLPVESQAVENNNQQKNRGVQEFAAKLKRAAPKNALDQLSCIQSERNSYLKMKIEFDKKKFNKEFDLNERKFAEDVAERKEKMELKRLEMDKEERLKKLELEKQERIEKYEIEMRYKHG